ncbi:MAG: hypothetical protein HC903_24440 [Methylacidiphilales bacterium]|nr:hypothetical protein [Candidatus Methylacidiphilales bacterium]NJR16659.1 hypothetical protein [Calothrix sp. CSU_2_0]
MDAKVSTGILRKSCHRGESPWQSLPGGAFRGYADLFAFSVLTEAACASTRRVATAVRGALTANCELY